MNRCFVALLMCFFVVSLITGCGQQDQGKSAQKPLVIKPEASVVQTTDEMDMEEESDAEEAPEPVLEAPKTVTGSAIEKAAALQEAQSTYQAKSQVAEEGAETAIVPEAAKPAEELIAADFDTGEKPNNLGTNFGAWNKDPSDPTQWCKESFENLTKRGDKGFSMKLDYSVDSPNPAYNGFWMMLPNLDATKYDNISFWVKGDGKTGYTTVFKVELKNANKQIGRYYVSNATDQWQEITIPLSEFKGLIDKTSLTEFVIVFEDRMATNKKGVIYIDDIKFIRK